MRGSYSRLKHPCQVSMPKMHEKFTDLDRALYIMEGEFYVSGNLTFFYGRAYTYCCNILKTMNSRHICAKGVLSQNCARHVSQW